METKVKFYAITYVDINNKPLNYSIFDFFKNLDALLEENVSFIRKDIEERYIRCFKSKSNDTLKYIVFPIGKRKDSKSYTEDENSKSIKEVDYNIFDVNHLYYDENKRVLIMTCNKSAPSYKTLETYLNSFLIKDRYKISIIPLKADSTLEEIRNSKRIKSVIITVDLGNDIETATKENYDKMQFLKSFSLLSKSAHEVLHGNKIKLELMLNERQKDSTMNIKEVVNLIENLNLESDFIKEIEVKYSNNDVDKLDTAKLKAGNYNVSYTFISKNSMKIEDFFLKGGEAFSQRATEWYNAIRKLKLNKDDLEEAPDKLLKKEYKDENKKQVSEVPV